MPLVGDDHASQRHNLSVSRNRHFFIRWRDRMAISMGKIQTREAFTRPQIAAKVAVGPFTIGNHQKVSRLLECVKFPIEFQLILTPRWQNWHGSGDRLWPPSLGFIFWCVFFDKSDQNPEARAGIQNRVSFGIEVSRFARNSIVNGRVLGPFLEAHFCALFVCKFMIPQLQFVFLMWSISCLVNRLGDRSNPFPCTCH